MNASPSCTNGAKMPLIWHVIKGELRSMYFFHRSSFKAKELEVSLLPQKLTLTMGKEPNVVNFDLFETSMQQKKEDLQQLIFAFLDKVEGLEGKLKGWLE